MKLTKVLLLGVAVFSMAACSGGHGTKVDEKAFIEEAQKCEDKTFSKATLSYSYTIKESANGQSASSSDRGSYTYTNNNGTYVLDGTQTVSSYLEGLDSLVGINVKTESSEVTSELSGGDNVLTFYKAPLGVSSVLTMKENDNDMNVDVRTETYVQFDKYGYFTKATYTTSEKMTMKAAGVKMTVNAKLTLNITVSYQ